MMANARAERLCSRSRQNPAPSCVSSALQLKREWSPSSPHTSQAVPSLRRNSGSRELAAARLRPVGAASILCRRSAFGRWAALRAAAPSGGWISRADRAQGTVAEPLGIALTRFRKCDDALRKRRTNGVVMVGGGAERGKRHLKGNTHLTDRFAVELMTVEVGSDGHRKRPKAASDCAQVP